MKITRREALKLGLTGSGVLLSPLAFPSLAQAVPCRPQQCPQETDPASSQTPGLGQQIPRFEQPFHRLEELEPVATTLVKTNSGCPKEKEIRYYQITLRKQKVGVVFAPDGQTPLKTVEAWIYQGSGSKPTQPWIVGPVIRQPKSGDKTGHTSVVRFINELGQDEKQKDICASVHLHGMASLPQYDGYAEDLIPPGYCKDYYYPNNRASTLWYHDHAVHKTARNVYMGLAGMYIVEYDAEDFANPQDFGCLPKGEFEVPLILQDKTFEISEQTRPDEWKLALNDRGQRGVYASVVLANGVPWPRMTVKRQKYYFRILNASPSRTYQLALSRQEKGQTSDPDTLAVIGSDAGLLNAPVYLTGQNNPLRIGVAERYGVIIDFAKFPKDVKQVFLRNVPFPSNLGTEPEALMRFDLSDEPVGEDPSYLPNPLGKVRPLQELVDKASCTRTLQFGRGRDWTINGKTWSCDRVEAYPHLCGVEIWELVNTGGWVHPVHIHLVDFRVISRNGQPPQPYEQGWKDVVLVKETERVRVIAQFGPHAGKYMIHCHNLVHEDHDMMSQFEVVSVADGGPSPACGTPLSTDPSLRRGPSPLCAPAIPYAEAPPLGPNLPPPNCPPPVTRFCDAVPNPNC